MYVRKLLTAVLLTVFSAVGWAQTANNAGLYYTIQPDYRLCPAPYCGGWWLTQVNRYSVSPDAALDGTAGPVVSDPIHVSSIDYRALGLTQEQIFEFENRIREGKGFIRGVLKPYPYPVFYGSQLQVLAATGTWVAANDNAPVGPYLSVRSTGILCITTPCPYYEAEVLNTDYRTPVHELDLTRAGLTDKQTELARREVEGKGLVMTGVRFPSQGQTGTGVGITATKVFFTFPGSATIN